MYKCPRCKANRLSEDMKRKEGKVTLSLFYSCGSRIVLQRGGSAWKVVNEIKGKKCSS